MVNQKYIESFILLCYIFPINCQISKLHDPATYLEPLNYIVDEFNIVTADGYILRLYHVRHINRIQDGPIVYLQHGLMSSSADFCVTGNKSLVVTLMEANFDVWMGNTRGGFYSSQHMNPSMSDRKYWKFSWDKIGSYDIPAFVDFILDYTKRPSLHYIGHSQGSTVFFVMTSLLPHFNEKISSMQALAPAVFMAYVKNPLFRVLAKFVNIFSVMWDIFQLDPVIAGDSLFNRITKVLCQSNDLSLEICSNIMCLFGDCSIDEVNDNLIPLALRLNPAPASVYQIFHFAQEMNSKRFCQYDFGKKKNLQNYGQTKPSNYNLTNIRIPVALYLGANDKLISMKDVKTLGAHMNLLDDIVEVPDKNFGHMDFCWGEDAHTLVYQSLIRTIKKHL